MYIFVDRRSVRGSIRVPASMKIEKVDMNEDYDGNICENCGELSDISDIGAKLTLSKITTHYPLILGNQVRITIADIGTVGAKILRKIDLGNSYELGVLFKEVDFETVNNINQFRFSNKHGYIQNARSD